LVHQSHNFIDDDEESLSSLHFGLYNYPYFDKSPTMKRTVSASMEYTEQTQQTEISQLSQVSYMNNTHFVIPPPIDENDSYRNIENTKYGQNMNLRLKNGNSRNLDVVNIGIPIPLMLPKHSIISTSIIIKQCDMILSPYLKTWKNNKIKPYNLYILTKNTIYCGICKDNAFCKGCKLNKYKEISTKDLDFIISIRWIDEDSFNSFDQTAFTLN